MAKIKATKSIKTSKIATSTKKKTIEVKPKKKFTHFNLRIRSRHPSANVLRDSILIPVRGVYRHGSTTDIDDLKYEINSIESVEIASSKFKMKSEFERAKVKTAEWFFISNDNTCLKKVIGISKELTYIKVDRNEIPFPIVAKLNYGSRGRGMFKLTNLAEFDKFVKSSYRSGYYFEKFYNYNREYRLHVDANGCFYSCRKLIKNDTPEDKRWYKNDSNCNWITQFNQVKQGEKFISFDTNKKEQFNEPVNWSEIVTECVKALKAVKGDIMAVDLRVQSAKDEKGKLRKSPDFIVVEINSAPSMGDITAIMYKNRLPQTLKSKYGIL